MKLGIDASTYFEVLEKGPHYSYEGKEIEPLSFLHDHNGVSIMRIRLWLDPYDKDGHPYHGGTNDWPTFLKLAKLANKDGYSVMLDFHYSDFWCDPSKQTMPKAWAGLSVDEVSDKLYQYTVETLKKCVKEKLDISYIQVGNEITNGMLWPLGKLVWHNDKEPRTGYDELSKFLKAGLKACKEIIPSAKRIIHLEKSGDYLLHQEFFDEITKRGVDFDVIGLSYYPYWHGTFEMLSKNITNLQSRFAKPVMIVETGYGFTMADFINTGNNGANLIREDFFSNPENHAYKPFPLTYEGQKDFVKGLIALSEKLHVTGIVYWEPLWLPLPGLEWASKEGEEYIHETHKPTHNEWANQCLFDYEGKATPALDEYKVR